MYNYYTSPLFELMQAVQNNDPVRIHEALKNGAPIDGDGEHIPLIWSANNDSTDMMALLLDLGAQLHTKNIFDENVMDVCCDNLAVFASADHIAFDMIVLLMNRGWDWQANYRQHHYTLARYAPSHFLKYFLDKGMLNGVSEKNGATVLHGLAMSQMEISDVSLEVIRHVTQNGEDFSEINFLGLTAWECAVGLNVEMAKMFEEVGQDMLLGDEILAHTIFNRHEEKPFNYTKAVQSLPIERLYALETMIDTRLNNEEVINDSKNNFSAVLKNVKQCIEVYNITTAVASQSQKSKTGLSKKM